MSEQSLQVQFDDIFSGDPSPLSIENEEALHAVMFRAPRAGLFRSQEDSYCSVDDRSIRDGLMNIMAHIANRQPVGISIMNQAAGALSMDIRQYEDGVTYGEFAELFRRAPKVFLGRPSLDLAQRMVLSAYGMHPDHRTLLRKHFGDKWLVWCLLALVHVWKTDTSKATEAFQEDSELPDITRALARLVSTGLDIDKLIPYIESFTDLDHLIVIQSGITPDMFEALGVGKD